MNFSNAPRTVKFLMFDAIVAAPLFILFIFPNKYVLTVLILLMILLQFAASHGLNSSMIIRKFRTILVGSIRYERPPLRRLKRF
ncbi:IcmT/TraK family protein [Vibrio splendidus]